MENEAIINSLLFDRKYRKYGFHFYRDVEYDSERICIMDNGKDNRTLNENIEDEYIEVLKVVEGMRK